MQVARYARTGVQRCRHRRTSTGAKEYKDAVCLGIVRALVCVWLSACVYMRWRRRGHAEREVASPWARSAERQHGLPV